MKSTGEVMGAADDFGRAFAKAWQGAGHQLPLEGTAFLSVNDADKATLVMVARRLADLGFRLVATAGTRETLAAAGLAVELVRKAHEERPHVLDHLVNREIDLVIETPLGGSAHIDDALIRQAALKYDIPCITTLSGARAAVAGIAAVLRHDLEVRSLQSRCAAPLTRS
jgi:carbamoyl-phosphate synthase large subunit